MAPISLLATSRTKAGSAATGEPGSSWCRLDDSYVGQFPHPSHIA